MPHAHDLASPLAFAPLALMWTAMMAAMMGPTVWPWMRAFARLTSGPASVATFATGYAAAWMAYGSAAAGAQMLLARAGSLAGGQIVGAPAGAVLLIGAGLYQLTPVKRACLTHCRNPLTYLMARWHDGPVSGFSLGATHGLYCLGCCWALMATAFVVGVMSLWWMTALAVVAFVEQVAPGGHRLRVPLGAGLVVWGASRLLPI